MQAYALCTVRNYVMMAIHAGCSEDQVFGMVVDGIDRATAARLVGRSSGEAAAASGQGTDAAPQRFRCLAQSPT